VRSTVFAVLILLLGFSKSYATSILDRNAPQVVIQAPLTGQTDAVITATELTETTPDQINELLKDAKTRNSDILVSTDQEAVINSVVSATASQQDHRLVRFIPLGRLASLQQKMAAGFSSYYQNARSTIMGDRIGLTVLTITSGYDSFVWIHSASLDIHQKTSMVLMNVVMAAAFGLDRDLWTRTTSPLKHFFIKNFDRVSLSSKISYPKILAAQFLSNLTFGLGLQLTRTGLLSLDHISTAVMSGDFWGTALKISALGTLSSFAWSEMFGAVSAEKNPIAKMMLKRIGEIRGVILCHLASISMVLQPEIYGHTPVISFIVHGSIGIIALANAHRIVQWLENNPAVKYIYKKVQTFEKFINGGLGFDPRNSPALTGPEMMPSSRSIIKMCRQLFAY
jgi:hypothetical protein